MKSIRQINTLPRERSKGWQSRLDEIHAASEAEAKDFARHHFTITVNQKLEDMRRALETQTYFAKMSTRELKAVGIWQSSNATGNVFGSWLVMDRLGPGFAAVRKIAGGFFPSELDAIIQTIWDTLDRVEDIRQRHYLVPAADRHFKDLSGEIEPLCEEFKRCVMAFYAAAKSRYDLPKLGGEGAK
jgi:hypothetical protein